MRIERIDPTNRDLRDTVDALVVAVNSLLPEGESVTAPREETLEPPWEKEGMTKDQYLIRWRSGQVYAVGEVVFHQGEYYEVTQAHTSQAGWEPPQAPALFTVHTPEGEVSAWVQPEGSHDAYALGDMVTHNGQTWQSTAEANVWEPGEYGWEVVD